VATPIPVSANTAATSLRVRSRGTRRKVAWTSLVIALTEDASVASFAQRKQRLREKIREAGGLAVTVFAADKLSDIVGLRRGIEQSRTRIQERMGTTIDRMADHYRESVWGHDPTPGPNGLQRPDSEFHGIAGICLCA
jgi:hypothetical protein